MCKKNNLRSIFFLGILISSTKYWNIKNHDLPAIAQLNKAKLTKVDNQVRISYRNKLALSFSSVVVELDVG